MSDATARFALPMIVPGQAQKEMSHNEALAVVDAVVQASVVAIGLQSPPSDPVAGQCWIVGDAPTGDWTGRADALAVSTAGGWRFVTPTPGFRAWVADAAVDARFVDGAWIVGTLAGERLVLAGNAMLSTPVDMIVDPTGGTVIDSAARTAISAILAALGHHNLMETPEM